MTSPVQGDWLQNDGRTWPRLALGYRYEVQLGKMLDEKRISGQHLRPYLRNVDVQWGQVNVDSLPEMDFDSTDQAKYSLRPGDLLVCEGGEVGRAALWSENIEGGIYFQKALHRLRPYDSNQESPRFMFYALRAAAELNAYGDGGKATIAHLPADAFRRVRFPKPTLTDQVCVANFLDEQTARIDALIAEKVGLHASLKDIEEVTAFDLTTRGLDQTESTVAYRELWLQHVPASWSLSKLRYLAQVGNGSTPKRDKDAYWVGGAIPWLNSGAVNAGRITEASDFVTPAARAECHLPMVRAGSTVVALTGQGKTRGAASFTEIDSTINQHLAFVSLRSQSEMFDEYLWVALVGLYSALRHISDGEGSTKGALTCEQLNQLRLPVPSPTEQQQIVAEFKSRVGSITALQEHVTTHIDRLREYRSSLISAAVTGQLNISSHISAVGL